MASLVQPGVSAFGKKKHHNRALGLRHGKCACVRGNAELRRLIAFVDNDAHGSSFLWCSCVCQGHGIAAVFQLKLEITIT